jgi:aryl-alcohol dehydrogenase-like predicted oxidoreductase
MPAKHTVSHFRRSASARISATRIEATDRSYTRAIVRAVQLGVNVIDSAANYRFQRSERSIGEALKILANEHGIAREELVICTKGGYLPFDGAPPRNVAQYVNETFVQPGIASFEDFVGGSHCMTPSYLQSQLDQSLRNMGLEDVDVYYIHNPESQLPYVSEQEFYARLQQAFERLEENRRQGKLAHYGVRDVEWVSAAAEFGPASFTRADG